MLLVMTTSRLQYVNCVMQPTTQIKNIATIILIPPTPTVVGGILHSTIEHYILCIE